VDFAFADLAAAIFLGTFVEEVFLTVDGFVEGLVVLVGFIDLTVDLVGLIALAGVGLLDLGTGMVFSLDLPALPAADSLTRPLGPLGNKKIPFSAPCMIA